MTAPARTRNPSTTSTKTGPSQAPQAYQTGWNPQLPQESNLWPGVRRSPELATRLDAFACASGIHLWISNDCQIHAEAALLKTLNCLEVGAADLAVTWLGLAEQLLATDADLVSYTSNFVAEGCPNGDE